MGTRSIVQIKARKNLLEIKEVFDNLKIKFWLALGTCLGAVREGHFISYDGDVDIMMLARDLSPKMYRVFHKIASFRSISHWPDKPMVIEIRKGMKIHILLKYYFSPKDIYIWPASHPYWQNCIMPGRSLRDDYWVNFLDTTFRAPNPPEEYLEQLYGKNWRIPLNPKREGASWKKQWKRIPDAKFAKYIRQIEKHSWIQHLEFPVHQRRI